MFRVFLDVGRVKHRQSRNPLHVYQLYPFPFFSERLITFANRLFEEAADKVGQSYLSGPFWEKWIEFESQNNNPEQLFNVYQRASNVPTASWQKFYNLMRHMASSLPVVSLVSSDLLEKFRASAEHRGVLPTHSGVATDPSEVDRSIRAQIDNHWQDTHQTVNTEARARYEFESKFRQPYFLPDDLDEHELRNWKAYLNWSETHCEYEQTRDLYERCLVITSRYEEFWLAYARWMKGCGKIEANRAAENTRLIYNKAACWYVPGGKTELRYQWAIFEESEGYVALAEQILRDILDVMPNHIETIVRLVGIALRHHSWRAGYDIFMEFATSPTCPKADAAILLGHAALLLSKMNGSTNQAVADKHNSNHASVAKAHNETQNTGYLQQTISDNIVKARTLFEDKLESFSDIPQFWRAYLEFEMDVARTVEVQVAFDPENDINKNQKRRVVQLLQHLCHKAALSHNLVKELTKTPLEWLMHHGNKDTAKDILDLDTVINGYVETSYVLSRNFIKSCSMFFCRLNHIHTNFLQIRHSPNLVARETKCAGNPGQHVYVKQ
jgi:pre-mRNA-processing factor 39